MVRLIDADALMAKLNDNAWNIDEWELPHDQVSAGLMANAMDRDTVTAQPTVDAIPIKWIEQYYGDEPAIYADRMIDAWRKDHETD